MRQFTQTLLVAVAVFATDFTNAAECTDAEWQTSQSIWSWAATTSACAQYAIGDSFVSAPCTALSCVAVMEQVGEQLPDCSVSGVNNKIEVQNAMTVCNGADLIATEAPLVTPPTAAPLVTIAPMTTSAPFETSAPLPTLAPRPGDSASGAAETTSTSTDGSVDWSVNSLSASGSSSTPSPAATSSSTSCTTSQISNLESLYTSAAQSSSCVPDATLSSYSVYIFTHCGSSCTSKLKLLAQDLPNCYYDYGTSNAKASLLEEIDACTGTNANYISTTLYLSSTSTATSAASRETTSHLCQALSLILAVVAGALL